MHKNYKIFYKYFSKFKKKILKNIYFCSKYGISVVLDSKPTLMAIATCIDCNDTPTMNVACTLLAVLAVLE